MSSETEVRTKTVAEVVSQWGIPPEKQLDVCRKLEGIGVNNVEDLKFLDPENDLVDLLLPIQVRRAKASIKEIFQCSQTDDWPNRSDISSPSQLSSLSESSDPNDGGYSLSHPSQSPSASSSNSDKSSSLLSPSQNWVASFRVPYSKFPPELFRVCEKGERPSSQLRREMIRILCAEINLYSRLPGKSNILIIANKIAARYPKSFCDVVNNEILGTGVASLVQQIMDRMVNAYSRGNSRKRVAANMNTGPEQKTRASDSYGCINYDPECEEDDDNLEEMKRFLFQQSFLANVDRDKDKDKIRQYMKDTYALQRQIINVGSPVQSVKNEWPLLFEEEFLLDHFKELTGIELKTTLKNMITEKYDRLVKFITIKKSKVKGIPLRLEQVSKAGNDMSITGALAILMVASCLGEDPDLLVKTYEASANSRDVEESSDMLTPYLAAIGNVLDPDLKLMLVIEKKVVEQNIKTLLDGICVVFASYYVFNMQYQEGLSSTLEFIQRCLVNLNPSSGSRSKTKRGIPNKVLSFLNGLNELDWNL